MTDSSQWWIVAAVFWGCAALLFVGGYLVRVHKKLHLLAGCRPEQVVDKEGLAGHAGAVLGWIGVSTAAVPLVLLVSRDDIATALIVIGYSAVVTALALFLTVTSRRYMR